MVINDNAAFYPSEFLISVRLLSLLVMDEEVGRCYSLTSDMCEYTFETI